MPPFHPPTGAELNTFIIKKFRNKDVTPRGSCYLLLVLAVQRSLGTRSTEIDQTWILWFTISSLSRTKRSKRNKVHALKK